MDKVTKHFNCKFTQINKNSTNAALAGKIALVTTLRIVLFTTPFIYHVYFLLRIR